MDGSKNIGRRLFHKISPKKEFGIVVNDKE